MAKAKQKTRFSAQMCVDCGYLIDAATCVTSNNEPTEGSVSLCLNCGAILQLRGNKWRKATKAQINAFPSDLKTRLFKLEYARRFVVRHDLTENDGHT